MELTEALDWCGLTLEAYAVGFPVATFVGSDPETGLARIELHGFDVPYDRREAETVLIEIALRLQDESNQIDTIAFVHGPQATESLFAMLPSDFRIHTRAKVSETRWTHPGMPCQIMMRSVQSPRDSETSELGVAA